MTDKPDKQDARITHVLLKRIAVALENLVEQTGEKAALTQEVRALGRSVVRLSDNVARVAGRM